jgi:murein lipoprotein
MMNKLLVAGVITTAVLLTGCANNKADLTDSVGGLNSEVSKLTDQVQSLQSEQDAMKSMVQSATDAAQKAQEEAERANMRIDNIAASYSK